MADFQIVVDENVKPKRFSVTDDVDWETGRVAYTVHAASGTKVGMFTVSWDRLRYPDREAALSVEYGDNRRAATFQSGPWPDAPVVYGIELYGGHTFDPDKALHSEHWTGHARRYLGPCRSDGVPRRTEQRVGQIVRGLARYHMARDDLAAIEATQNRYEAPRRMVEHRRNIERIRDELAAVQARLERECLLGDMQAALLEDCVAVTA